MKLKIVIHGTELTATLIDSETSKDFVSLLPLTLTMNDLFGREKFGHLPRAISTDGPKTHAYDVGDIAYWSPGPVRGERHPEHNPVGLLGVWALSELTRQRPLASWASGRCRNGIGDVGGA